MIGDSDDDASGGVGSDNVYNKKVEPVLVLLFNLYLYSKDKILLYNSRPSSCPVYTFY